LDIRAGTARSRILVVVELRSFAKRTDDVGESQANIRTIMTFARDIQIDAVADVETTNELVHIDDRQRAVDGI
jgi:hypothetical protein